MIDIVIPVYRGLEATRRCVESVLAATAATPCEVVVVDDSSPEAEVADLASQLAAAGRVTLLRNERNLGFVHSVNRGMSLHPDRDVVLLNSDTEVANDWLDRLVAASRSAPRVATVTPFSNNATICSYPFEGWPGGVPGAMGLAALDRLFADTNARRILDIPTAVGFCMLIRREALATLGLFDAERFGRGYGEENDFCMRASKGGWRNVLAADVFVYHEGSVSFAAERAGLSEAATRALLEVHPEYLARVHEFIVADPARPLREAIDVARACRGPGEAGHVVAERSLEHARLMAKFRELEDHARLKGGEVVALSKGLARAQELVAERDLALEKSSREYAEALATLDAEIGRLRAGLAYAEKLAFERQDELARIKSNPVWRALLRLRGRRASEPTDS